MKARVAKFYILNLLGIAGLVIAGLQGWLFHLWVSDVTYLVTFITVVFIVGLWQVRLARWEDVEFIRENLVILGLIGTVVGFIIALAGVVPDAVSDAASNRLMIATLISGIKIAVHTTLVGMVGYFWLGLNWRFTKENEDA